MDDSKEYGPVTSVTTAWLYSVARDLVEFADSITPDTDVFAIVRFFSKLSVEADEFAALLQGAIAVYMKRTAPQN